MRVISWLPLETDRLLLREFRPSDEADIHEYASDPEVVRLTDWGPKDLATTRGYLTRCLDEQ